jgi:hypothetical protein
MNSDTITAICEGRSFIKRIVVSANIANPARHTCNKGEKTKEGSYIAFNYELYDQTCAPITMTL